MNMTKSITWAGATLREPKVKMPQRGAGFGTRLIARALGEQGSTSLEYPADGVICRIRLAIGSLDDRLAA